MRISPAGQASVPVAGLLIGLFIAAVAGCSDAKLRSLMEKEAGPLLLPGYTDFTIDREDVDVGVIVFSYRTPPGIPAEEIVTTVHDRLRAAYPCYSVLQQSSDGMQIRCGNRRDRLSGTEEYRFGLHRERRRLFVLSIRDVPAQADVYNEFINTLDEARNEMRRP